MAKPHSKLRGALVAADIDQRYLARLLLRDPSYISQRMMGRKTWELSECYHILDILRIPHAQLADYFPPNGVAS